MDENYQELIIELYKNPLNFGEIKNADLKGETRNLSCGDVVTLYIKLDDKKIIDARHAGAGCAISQASASLLTEYLKGKTLEEAKKINKDDILKLIRIDLSKNPTRMKCALVSLDALKKALNPNYDCTM